MPQLNPERPDLAIVLALDRFAPRAARHHVAQVDRPSPDLRDAVVLLSSELVTQAVERSSGQTVELRVWMTDELVRVEVRGSHAVVDEAPPDPRTYGSLLLDQIADRWAFEVEEPTACIWFEIDRHPAAVEIAHARA